MYKALMYMLLFCALHKAAYMPLLSHFMRRDVMLGWMTNDNMHMHMRVHMPCRR